MLQVWSIVTQGTKSFKWQKHWAGSQIWSKTSHLHLWISVPHLWSKDDNSHCLYADSWDHKHGSSSELYRILRSLQRLIHDLTLYFSNSAPSSSWPTSSKFLLVVQFFPSSHLCLERLLPLRILGRPFFCKTSSPSPLFYFRSDKLQLQITFKTF